MENTTETVTRKFPRTMIEAFGPDAAGAYAITHYKRPSGPTAKSVILLVVGYLVYILWMVSQ